MIKPKLYVFIENINEKKIIIKFKILNYYIINYFSSNQANNYGFHQIQKPVQ